MLTKISLRQWLCIALGVLISALLTYLMAAIAQSLFVLSALDQMNAEISWPTRLTMILDDIYGLAFAGRVSFAQVILIGFAVAMPSAALVHRYLKIASIIVYPLAGAVALATILYIVKINFNDLTLFAGTRGHLGYLSQLIAGAIGGGVFLSMLTKVMGR